jgi:hypothetical protein
MLHITHYVVVENAGYEGENELFLKFDHYQDALEYRNTRYEDDEIEAMHVEIAAYYLNGDRTFEVG